MTLKNGEVMRLKKRIAIVTGGAGGIGEAIALMFAQHGAGVIVADLNYEGATETAKDINKKGGLAHAIKVDVTKIDSVQNLIDESIKTFKQLDILVNVAGVGGFGHFIDVRPEEFDNIMRINVTASLYCAQAAAKEMLKSNYGRIINVASIAGERAGEHRTAYGTSKAAVIGLTKQGARDLGGQGITVNAIAPGPVDTPLTRRIHTETTRANYIKVIPAGRYGTVEEMADAALFLAGEAAGYVNGHVLFVDGGYVSAGVAEAEIV
jgi:3-oxoacyl-[acyl-carrier protein] reductase